MYCEPKLESNGQLVEKPEYGGRRRVDRILVDPSLPMKAEGVGFISAVGGDSDHVPVCLKIGAKA